MPSVKYSSSVSNRLTVTLHYRYIYFASTTSLIRCRLDCSLSTLSTRSTPAIALTLGKF